MTFWIRIFKSGFYGVYAQFYRRKPIVKELGGKEFGYEGKKVICGAGNNKSKEVFKQRKTSWCGQAGIKQYLLEKKCYLWK